MKFLEKDLEEIIFNAKNDLLQDRGLPILGKKFRQVNLGGYGIADLITVKRQYNGNILITVYELKKDRIGVEALLQACRYARCVKQYTDNRHPDIKYSIEVVLIGSDISYERNFNLLSEIFPTLYLYTYSYEFEGIYFHQDGKNRFKTPNSF